MANQVIVEAKKELLESLGGLFNSERYSDVTLFLGPEEVKFRAHYAVLGIRTSYFNKTKEKGFEEDATNEYRFPSFSAHSFWRVLQYFYTGDYSTEPNQIDGGGGDDIELFKHPKVYAIADVLDLGGLKKLCVAKFEEQLAQHWISDTFTDTVREVYTTTYSNDRLMRDTLVKVARQHARALIVRKDFIKLLKDPEIVEFSGELLSSVISSGY